MILLVDSQLAEYMQVSKIKDKNVKIIKSEKGAKIHE
jgi:hypothetical protein